MKQEIISLLGTTCGVIVKDDTTYIQCEGLDGSSNWEWVVLAEAEARIASVGKQGTALSGHTAIVKANRVKFVLA